MWIDDAQTLLLFIPLVVIGCGFLRRHAPTYVASFLLAASIVFYVMADWHGAWVMAILMIINLSSIAACAHWHQNTRMIIGVSVILHLLPLAVWKYLDHGAMPLGLSFVTFLLISALIDIRSGAPRLGLVQQTLHALFFASVTAGPITRYRDMAPQLKTLGLCQVSLLDIIRGASLVVVGLAKIGIMGRPLRDNIDSILLAVQNGTLPTIIEAWYVAFGGLLSLYFLFSGYSDVAIGIGMMVGLSLSSNFDSPFKAHSGPDFVSRWHMSLMNWIRAYVFIPLTQAILACRFARPTKVSFVAWATASLLSFTIIGAWHGIGWAPVLAGLVSGVILILGQMMATDRRWPAHVRFFSILRRPFLLTMVSLISVPILIQNLSALHVLFVGLLDVGSFSLGQRLAAFVSQNLPEANNLPMSFARPAMPNALLGTLPSIALLGLSFLIILFCPNTLQMFGLPNRSGPTRLRWRPTVTWAVALAVLAMATVSVATLTKSHGFIYDAF